MKYIRIICLVPTLLLLLFLPSQVRCQSEYMDKGKGETQTKAALPFHCQQVFRKQIIQEFITLILKGDICALLNRCEVPPLSKAQKRSFFSIFPPCGQAEVRLQRDKLLRHYIDRIRELIIVFSRLNISTKSEVNYYPIPNDSPDHFTAQVKIKTSPSPLAATISPDLDGKSLLLNFTLTVNCSEKAWKISDISNSNFFDRKTVESNQ